ncbi:MAG TPA: potassium-transporting ATPase subunit KdpA [Oligoflexia bacterium]|nr:potassium-transporting ATPase subunit KdpA [Oligoflexia bacterium]
MNYFFGIQIVVYIALLTFLAPLLGKYFARVYQGKATILTPLLGGAEKLSYKLSGIDASKEMTAFQYGMAVVVFNALGFAVLFVLLISQSHLPLNPQGLPNVSWPLAFNTAISFVTNTNWQAYSGEASLSYFVQMVGLTVQNLLSAATGMAVLVALSRGISRSSMTTIGNFWSDLVKSIIYILFPLSLVWAVVLMSQGVVQTFTPYVEAISLEGMRQLIPLGPVASQIAIKQLGTNGGGFFGVNSAHPFENPTPFSNFVELLGILLIPAALVFMYGHLCGARKHARIIYTVMLGIFISALAISLYGELSYNPTLGLQASMEGKEVRFGVENSVLWSVATTAASNGSVNAMHDSLSPLSGGVSMFLILLGEIIFGGVGVGMCGMIFFVILTVFLAGLMVGRTPEYLGKKIEKREIQMVIFAIIGPSAVILLGTGFSAVFPNALQSLSNQGPHGLSELLYAFASAAGNNGSAFAGLNANTTFFNICLGLTMLVGRFIIIIPALIIGGSLVQKKVIPSSAGTFSTENGTFSVLLVSVIIILGALTFFPTLCLGPIVEHLLMLSGRSF